MGGREGICGGAGTVQEEEEEDANSIYGSALRCKMHLKYIHIFKIPEFFYVWTPAKRGEICVTYRQSIQLGMYAISKK